ncbi:MAG: phosphoesterase [Candidatus Helarchaeota archaeon]
MKKLFISSDHHFGHRNIIKYCNRPFCNIEEMNRILIYSWNRVVNPNDTVFYLGDFSLTNFEETKKILTKLNGTKFLIMGNHDRYRSKKWWLRCGFEEVHKHPVQLKEFILSHKPIRLEQLKNNNINIHGHIHINRNTLIRKNKFPYYNVNIEFHNFCPIRFSKIIWWKRLNLIKKYLIRT